MREHPALKPLGKWLQNPEIWHFHRRSAAGAAFIGLFVSFLPIPMHMLIAGAIAIVTRCNLPLAVALVWVNNPLTMGPLYFFAYKLGAWLLNTELTVSEVHINLAWLGERFDEIWRPLLLGFAGMRLGQRTHRVHDRANRLARSRRAPLAGAAARKTRARRHVCAIYGSLARRC